VPPVPVINLPSRCNNRCVFCPYAEQPLAPTQAWTSGFERTIELAGQAGIDSVVLSGPEPTIYPDLGRLIRTLRARHMRFGLVSNGRLLSYPQILDKLLKAGCCYLERTFFAPESPYFAWSHVRQCCLRGLAYQRQRPGKLSDLSQDVQRCVADELPSGGSPFLLPNLSVLRSPPFADAELPLPRAGGAVRRSAELPCRA